MITNSQISNSAITQVFSSTNQSAVTTAIFCNVSTSTAALDVYIVPFPQNVASSLNQIIKGVIIPPAETFVLDTERFILEDKDAIYAQVDNGTVISTISSVNT